MDLFVKICGLANRQDTQATLALQPDALGFVFWKPSPRAVRPEEVRAWTQEVPASIKKVGVFVDASREDVLQVMETADLDIAQLHGSEPPEFCQALDCTVWKALHLDRVTPDQAAAYDVDGFLIDRYSTESPGGTGLTVDWEAARTFVVSSATPVMLAGGLTPENVALAARQVRPAGVDVSSGVEARKGSKDITKVEAFIKACRNL